ncbi:MAG: zinc ribbon domain-containing protein [Pseudomonadota bacterium]
MPIYEYQCAACAHEFDELQKLSDPPLSDCPECDESALVKLVSAPSFRLKGSGWYETDFKKDKRKNLADSGDGGDRNKDSAKSPDKKDGGTRSETQGANKSSPSDSATKAQATPAKKSGETN